MSHGELDALHGVFPLARGDGYHETVASKPLQNGVIPAFYSKRDADDAAVSTHGVDQTAERAKRVGDVLLAVDDDVDVDALFAAADVDGSGKLDEQEFTALLEELSEKTRGHRNVSRLEFELARGSLDANRDGLIDLSELREEFYHRKLKDASDRLFLDQSGKIVAGAPA